MGGRGRNESSKKKLYRQEISILSLQCKKSKFFEFRCKVQKYYHEKVLSDLLVTKAPPQSSPAKKNCKLTRFRVFKEFRKYIISDRP